MIYVETLGKIRRRYFVNGETISQIARDFRLTRKTVRKLIKSTDPAPKYVRQHQPQPKLGAFQTVLEDWLKTDSQRPRRERRTAQRLYEGLQREGYTGAYDSVQRFVKHWKAERRPSLTQAFVPLSFLPGAKYQFDWSHEVVVLGGVVQTVKVAHFRLCYSRRMFVAAFPRETQEMIFEAHNRAFTGFGGVPLAGIYDNPKPIVTTVFTGKEREFNRRFLALMNHYRVEPIACTPASGWEKGQVENQVGNVREWLFTPRPVFADFTELNAWLEQRCQELAQRFHPEQSDRRIAEVFEEERPLLRPITAAFDGYFEQTVRVSSTCRVARPSSLQRAGGVRRENRIPARLCRSHPRGGRRPDGRRTPPEFRAGAIDFRSLALSARVGTQTRRVARWGAFPAVGTPRSGAQSPGLVPQAERRR